MKIKRKTLFGLMFVLLIALSLFVVSVIVSAADGVSFEYKGEIFDEYARGTYFEVPELTVKSSQGSHVAEYKLFYPNNRESTNYKNYLDVEGDYTLKYYYELDGEKIEIDKHFNVYTSVTSFFNSEQAEFTVNTALNPDIKTGSVEYKGLGVSSKKIGTVVTYLREIDLSDNTKNDTLIEFIANPQTINLAEITTFTIRLTDVNDPDNWLQILVKNVSYARDYYLLWAKANFNYSHLLDNPTYGIGLNRGNTYSLDGGRSPGFGALGSNSTANSYGVGDGKHNIAPIKLCLDYSEKAIYCTPRISNNDMVADLDLTSDVGAGNEWKGFSSDKAILTIETNLSSSSANYILLNVDGYDLSDYKLSDTENPTIDVDCEDNVPFGVVGVEYPLFNVTAHDNIDDYLDAPTVEVEDNNGRKVEIINNRFTPRTAGQYEIIYTVFDTAGNRGERIIDVNVKDNYGSDALRFDNNIVDTINIKIGGKFKVEEEVVSGGSGKILHNYSLIYDNQVVARNFDSYIFNTLGDFSLEYTATDYLGTTVMKTYEIKVEANSEPIFDMPFIADYYVFGKTYYLPKVSAYDFSKNTNGEIIEVKVKVNEIELGSDLKWVPTQAGDFEIVYYAVSKYDEQIITQKIKTVNVIKPSGGTFITDYFIKNNVETSLTTSGALFKTQSEDNGFKFVHPVATAEFALNFNVFTNGQREVDSNFVKFNIILTDALNPDVQLKLTFKKAVETIGDIEKSLLESKTSNFYLNNVYCSNVSGSFYGTTNVAFSVRFDDKENQFIDYNNGNILTTVKRDASGKTFNGFPSGEVYVEFSFENVSGESAIELSQLSNQTFNDGQQMDKKNPFIVLSNEMATNMEVGLNSKVSVPSAKAYDVLSVNPTLTLTVRDPKGKTVYSGNADNGCEFVADQYGIYSILYYAEDSAKQFFELPFACNVVDKVKPSINLTSELPTTVRVGDSVKLPSFTVQDDYIAKPYYKVSLFNPDCSTVDITESDAYVFAEEGAFRIVYYVVDDNGNSDIKIYMVYAINGEK